MKKRVIGYTRVSTLMQNESGAGLHAQEKAIRDFCSKQGFILLELFSEAHTGKDENRPILKECIKACQEQGANIVVAKLDRLSRRMAFIISFKETYHLEFFVANLGMDVNKTMLYLLALFAELERDMISSRVKEGISQKKKDGTYRKPSGNKELWKSGKGSAERTQKAQKHRHQIYKELEFIYKRYMDKQIISDPKVEKAIPTKKEYVQKLNERGNKTFIGYEWTEENFSYLIRRYPEEIELFNFKVAPKKSG